MAMVGPQVIGQVAREQAAIESMQCTVLVDCRTPAGSEVGWADTNNVGGARRPIVFATLTRHQLKLLT
jgi:hypothetical protein